jgi:hypothetical protein
MLQNSFAIAAQSLLYSRAIAAQSLSNRWTIAAQTKRWLFKLACNRWTVALRSPRNSCAIVSESLDDRGAIAVQSQYKAKGIAKRMQTSCKRFNAIAKRRDQKV